MHLVCVFPQPRLSTTQRQVHEAVAQDAMRRDHATHQSPGEAVGRHVLAGDPHALHARHAAGAETLLDLKTTGGFLGVGER